MTIQPKNISQSLNLFGASSLCSIMAIPAGSANYAIGAGVFALGMACNVAGAILLTKNNEKQQALSPQAHFAMAASATAMGAISMGGAAFMSINEIVHDTSVSFTSMGAGFAMATGMISFYGGLRGLKNQGQQAKTSDLTVSSP